MSSPAITDHVVQAVARMFSQYKKKEIIRAFIEVAAERQQLLEDVLDDMITGWLLDNAVGVQLETYGELAKELRGELTVDSEYRRIIRVKLAALQSDGEVPKTIQIAFDLIEEVIEYSQLGRAFYQLQWETTTHLSADMRARVARILDLLPPSGVGYQAVEGETPVFRYDSGPGYDNGQYGDLLPSDL